MKKSLVIKKTFKEQGAQGVSRLLLESYVLRKRPSYVPIFPSTLQVEVTGRCNLKCEMCDVSLQTQKRPDLSFKNFKKIMDQFKYLRHLNLQGLGEPTLNKDLFKMIDYAKGKKVIHVFTITNATLFSKSIREKIIRAKLDSLTVSIDSPIPKEYNKIRRGAKFDNVMKNLKAFIKENKKIKVFLSMTCSLDNIDSVPLMLELVHDLKIKNFHVGSVHDWGRNEWKKKISFLDEDTKKSREIILNTAKEAKKKGINFSYSFLGKDNKARCTWPWTASYITCDGYVTPCCIRGINPKKLSFGNVFVTPFKEIWNNNKYNNFREAVNKEKPPKFCKGCREF